MLPIAGFADLPLDAVAELLEFGQDVLALLKKDRQQAIKDAQELNPQPDPTTQPAAA